MPVTGTVAETLMQYEAQQHDPNEIKNFILRSNRLAAYRCASAVPNARFAYKARFS